LRYFLTVLKKPLKKTPKTPITQKTIKPMDPIWILISFFVYTALLFAVSAITSRKADNESFFRANKRSPWYLVAYGMIGASLSGVTFISVPGAVGSGYFSYLVMVIGYLFGYWVIIKVLLPLYYRLNLTSIYTYLQQRFGNAAYHSGAIYFLVSRVIGASFRMFLVVSVLQYFVLDFYHVPFVVTVAVFIGLILLYTMKAGIKTIVWTDTLQTTFMMASVVISIFFIAKGMNLSIPKLTEAVVNSDYSQVIITDWQSSRFFLKQFFSGMFITIVMTGLDQDMMQKNLSCRNLEEAQKNMTWMSLSLVPINLLFLALGAALYIYAAHFQIAIPDKADQLFPLIAIQYMGPVSGIVFIIGLIAAAYSSADSALTSLTTSMSVDIFKIENNEKWSKDQQISYRKYIHLGMSFIVFLVIVWFSTINKDSVINELFKVAGFTYGPLLGLFAFGLFSQLKVRDKLIPIVVIAAPLISYLLDISAPKYGYHFGFEILIVNGLLSFLGLFLISEKVIGEETKVG
jgi:Na+/proline symporter